MKKEAEVKVEQAKAKRGPEETAEPIAVPKHEEFGGPEGLVARIN